MKLPQRATILEPVDTGQRDRLNRPIYDYRQVGTPLPAYKQQEAAREVSTPAGATEVADWLIFLQYSPLVNPRHRLSIDGQTYEALSVDDPAGRHHHLEVLAKRVG